MIALVLTLACIPVLETPGGADDGGDWLAPENRWPSATPPADLRGEGYARGDILPDFRMLDQFGDEVALWQFYGRAVVVDISTMWCSPCQELAATVQETADAYDDLTYLTVLPQDLEYDVPAVDELLDWADAFDIEEPVLADGEGWSAGVVSDDQYPAILVVDRDMRVHERVSPISDETIRDSVEEIL